MTWQSRTADLKEKIRHLNSGEMSDVTIIVGKEKRQFRTHKWLLSMYSEEFHDMFYGPLATTMDEITLANDNVETFDIFIRYIYTDDLEINSYEQAFPALIFADKYRVNQMKAKCVKLVAEFIPSNIISEIFEASTSMAPKSWSESSSNNGNKSENVFRREYNNPNVSTVQGSSGTSLEDETPDHLVQSLPTMDRNTHHSTPYTNRSARKVNSAEDLTRSLPLINECACNSNTYPVKEDAFQKTQVRDRYPKRFIDLSKIFKESHFKREKNENVSELFPGGNSKSEVDLNAALLKWGRLQYQSDMNPKLYQKLQELFLHDELGVLKEKRFESLPRNEQELKASLLNLHSRCTKNWISSTSFPYIKERFRSRELDLYVYGVTLILKCNSNDSIKETPIAKLKVSNLTKNVNSSKKISVLLDGSERPISLKLLYPIFVGKGEECEIVLKSESNVKSGQYIYCGEICCLDHRLDRLDNCSVESERVGHFNSIIAIKP